MDINPVTFQIDPQEDFIDLMESFFKVEFVAKEDNNSNLLAGYVMRLVNNLVHSLFKQINIRLNSTLLSSAPRLTLTTTKHSYKQF